jgi:hypothetical protein
MPPCHATQTRAENASCSGARYIGRIYGFSCVIAPLVRSLGKLFLSVTGQPRELQASSCRAVLCMDALLVNMGCGQNWPVAFVRDVLGRAMPTLLRPGGTIGLWLCAWVP